MKPMPTDAPLVSIVTPVYNAAAYLPECIESILAQTYPHWDYTIIDNCSTDDSPAIARSYAAKDSRIRVQRNDHCLPAMANHNMALRQLSRASKYCKVVFADDWIFPECLQKMVAVAEEHPTAGIVGSYCLEGQQVICTGLPYTTRLISGREVCRLHLLEQLYLFGSANSLLYRSELVRARDPFFDEANIHGDTEVCFALLRSCDFGFVHQVLTFTRLRPGSLNTVSSDHAAYFAGMLLILARHGAHYLTAEELSTRRNQELSDYYRFLSKSLFLRRDRGFWEYHKKKLIELGYGLSRARLARATLANLLAAALRPADALRRIGKAAGPRGLGRTTTPGASSA